MHTVPWPRQPPRAPGIRMDSIPPVRHAVLALHGPPVRAAWCDGLGPGDRGPGVRGSRESGGAGGLVEKSQVAATPPEHVYVRYRLTVLQRLLPALPGLVVVVPSQVLLWLNGGSLASAVVPGLLIWGVLLPLVQIISRRFGVTLTPTAAVVHNLRRRAIPWADVQAIQIESVLGSRAVVIYEAGGRHTRLRAPMSGFLSWDRGFEEKFHTIGRWWLQHRGPDWVPVPPPGVWWGGPPASHGNPYTPTA